MNFYQSQRQARQKSRRLVAVFLVATLIVGLLPPFFLGLFLGPPIAAGAAASSGFFDTAKYAFFAVFDLDGLAPFTLSLMAFIVVAAGVRMLALAGGGYTVAEEMGGIAINSAPRSFEEKQLLNVVEEMAIASGLPVPGVYVIDSPGINAFAAGLTPPKAVVAVTSGALQQLTRSELQAVVAHEFSHILNGDVRLNTRLIGLVFGINFLAVMGGVLLRTAGWGAYGMAGASTRSVVSVGSSRSSGSGTLYLTGIGLVFMLSGFAGRLLGGLIKAAVSREREYLADAHAVRLTRDNVGLSNALKRIASNHYGAGIPANQAEEYGHMLIAKGFKSSFASGWMSTHPPLRDRIQRLEPGWDGSFPKPLKPKSTPMESSPVGAPTAFASAGFYGQIGSELGADGVQSGFTEAPNQPASTVSTQPPVSNVVRSDQVIKAVAPAEMLSESAIAKAHNTIQRLNQKKPSLVKDSHEPFNVMAILCASLLVLGKQGAASADLQPLRQHLIGDLLDLVPYYVAQLQSLSAAERVAIIDATIPIVRQYSSSQYSTLQNALKALIESDARLDFHEWAFFQWVNYCCKPKSLQLYPVNLMRRFRYAAMSKVLSSLVALHESDDQAAAKLIESLAQRHGLKGLVWTRVSDLSFKVMNQALAQLSRLPLNETLPFLEACVNAAEHDGVVDDQELVILHCLANVLGCPFSLSV